MNVAYVLSLRHAGPAGWVAGTAWIAASVFAMVLLFRAARGSSRPLHRLATSAVACACVGLAASVFLLAGARRSMLAIALGLEDPARDPPGRAIVRWFDAIELTGMTLFDGGVALACCVVLFALGAIASAVRVERPLRSDPRPRALVHTAAALALAMALGAARTGAALLAALDLHRTEPFGSMEESSLRVLGAPLAGARAHVVVIAAVGWIAAAWLSLRASDRPLHRHVAACAAAFFVIGLGAFAATRGMAYDGRHPIPRERVGNLYCPDDARGPLELPVAAGGEPFAVTSWLTLRPDGAFISPGVSPKSPAHLDELLREQRDYWMKVTHRTASEMRPMLVAAPDGLSTAEAAIWLGAIEEHLTRGFVLVVIDPERRFPTRTLGEVASTPHCGGIPVILDPTAPLLTSLPAWGDLVRGDRDARAPIRIRLH
jgi:hypothetical protein